jgi:long-chain acyl-CoA synthetase
MSISEHIQQVTRAGGDHIAIDFNGQTLSWKALADCIVALQAQFDAAGVAANGPIVGLLGRNSLAPVAGFIGTLGSGRGLLLVNALRPAKQIASELSGLRLAVLLADPEDLSHEVLEAATAVGTQVIALYVEGAQVNVQLKTPQGEGPFRQREPGTLIEIQTSGTTGAPKRIPVAERTVEASLRDGVRSAKGTVEQAVVAPKSSPTLMFGPLVHTSGTFNTLMSVFELRPIVLFEKFDPDGYVKALVLYRPKFAALPPTAMKMLVDSAATREDFSSVLAVRAGTAPLSMSLQEAFEQRFGVPVLTTYGATEFMGVVTSWTLDDYRAFGSQKRGSVGRVSKGVQIRVTDPVDGNPMTGEEPGLLEAKLDRIEGGQSWIRTTDLARIDADGFLYIVGRADDAIIRGGFKVMAGKVADVLKLYPGVNEAIVLGVPDERLGELPVALVEVTDKAAAVDEAGLRAFAKEQLVPYEVPARIHVVPALPRTVSDKVSRPEARLLLRLLTP